ncbi:helix-turn-helix transcriptional regulator [Microbacterium sp. NPDC055683]
MLDERISWAGMVPVPEPDLAQLRGIFNDHRHRSGLTYEQLSEQAGISRQTLLNLAAGRFHGDLRTWIKLSRAFGVTLDDLLSSVMPDDTSS